MLVFRMCRSALHKVLCSVRFHYPPDLHLKPSCTDFEMELTNFYVSFYAPRALPPRRIGSAVLKIMRTNVIRVRPSVSVLFFFLFFRVSENVADGVI